MTLERDLPCHREPIRVPGSIQPYGVLIVVDPATDRIVQTAGPSTELLRCEGRIVDRLLEEIIGLPASTLVGAQRSPSSAVRVRCRGSELVAIAHRQSSFVVVELERAAPQRSAEALFELVDWTNRGFSAAETVQDACYFAAGVVRAITGYDRILAYRFVPDWSGIVVSENRNDTFPTMLNHRFPESDIPEQARALYLQNPIRVIPTASYEPAPLLPTTSADLDMTHCLLRSVSPTHLQYLRNMGVGGSMSVSIIVGGTLWGLLAAHSKDSRSVPYESRELCKLIGWTLARQIELLEQYRRLQETQRLAAKREEVLLSLRSGSEPQSKLGSMLSTLRELVPSDGIALVFDSALHTEGSVPPEDEIRKLVYWLASKTDQTSTFSTDSLSAHLPAAADFSQQASGLLSVMIPDEHPIWLIWFRAEQVMEVEWAGNPHEKMLGTTSALSPRKSFDVWRQTVLNRSRDWTDLERESALLFATRVTAILQAHSIRNLNRVLQKMNAELSVEAATDPLTGIGNRRAHNKKLREEWDLAQTNHVPLGLVMCDIDYFKAYNDHFGHPAGDACLRQVARVLNERRRLSDTASRVGGEEFCLLLPETGLEGAMAVAEDIRLQIEGLAMENPGSPLGCVTVSLGVTSTDSDNVSNEQDLVSVADLALYQAKRNGRNRAVGSTWRTADHHLKLSV